MNNKNINTNNPDHIALNDDPAAVNALANLELDDLVSARPDLKSADNQPEPATDHDQGEKSATDGGAKVSPASKNLRNTNALRHGAYSYGLLPWELKEDFEALHQSFREDCKPQGAYQEEAVFALSHWTWKRQRVLQGSEISYFRSPVAKGLKSGTNSWDDIVRHQAKVPEYMGNLTTGLWKIVDSLSRVSDTIGEHYYWTDTDEGKEIQSELSRMRSDVGRLSSGVRNSIEGTKRIGQNLEKITGLFDHAYQPDEMEKQVKLLSMIDREIDKTIRRIICWKTFKSIEDEAETRKAAARMPPLLDSPSTMPEKSTEINESTEANGDPHDRKPKAN